MRVEGLGLSMSQVITLLAVLYPHPSPIKTYLTSHLKLSQARGLVHVH